MTKKAQDFGKLTKTETDCLNLLESLGIYELRALARIFGDNSPTTLKRGDHINIVMNKIISGEDLKPIPMRQGRPYKELSNIEGILTELSQIAGKDYTLKTNQSGSTTRVPKIVTFRQLENNIFEQKLFPIDVKGVLREKSPKEFYIKNQSNGKMVLIRKDFDTRLKEFDYITGTAVIMNQEKEYMIENIKSINFQSAKTYKDIVAPYSEPVSPTKKFAFAKTEILLGGRYVCKASKFSEISSTIKSVNKKLNENKIVSLALVPNLMPEDENLVQSLGFNTVFSTRYDERPLDAYETILNFASCVQRLQQQGVNIALFVEDFVTLSNIVDFAFKSNTKALMGHTESAVETIKNIVLLARASQNGVSTTLFTTFEDCDMFDPTYISSVYKISKKIGG